MEFTRRHSEPTPWNSESTADVRRTQSDSAVCSRKRHNRLIGIELHIQACGVLIRQKHELMLLTESYLQWKHDTCINDARINDVLQWYC